MVRLGHLTVIKKYRQCNTYILNELFFDDYIRRSLRHLLPQLHDEKLSRRKEEAALMHESLLAFRYMNIKTVSNIKIYSDCHWQKDTNTQKMSPFLKGNITMRAGASFDEEKWSNEFSDSDFYSGIDMDWKEKGQKEKREPQKEYIESIFLIPDQISPEDINNKNDTHMKKEISMKTYELKSIKPTLFGQIRLLAFPEAVVYEIDRRIVRMKERPQKPWQYFISSCKRYCEENGIDIDWNIMQQLAGKYCMPDFGPFIDESFIPIQIQSKSKSNNLSQKSYDMGKAQENERIMTQNGLDAMERQKQKHEAEWYRTRVENPEKFARWEENSKALRQLMGLNEQGEFIKETTPQQAIAMLVGNTIPERSANAWSNSTFIDSVCDMESARLMDYDPVKY